MIKKSVFKILKGAISLNIRYYLSPISLFMMIILLVPCAQIFVPEILALFQAGISVFLVPWALVEFSKILVFSLFMLCVIALNIIFYPWVNQQAREFPLVKNIFKGRHGVKGFIADTWYEMRIKYIVTPQDITKYKNYGYTYKVERSNGTKKSEAFLVLIKRLLTLYLRFIILCFVWSIGWIIGWRICKLRKQ